MPEKGFITYTVGLLLDHMSTYVAGTKTDNGDSDNGGSDNGGSDSGESGDNGNYGPCFIGSSHTGNNISLNIPFIILSLFGAITFAGGFMFKRIIPILTILTAVLLLVHPHAGIAAESAAIQASASQKTATAGPWSFKAGLGFGYIGEEYQASAGGTTYELTVDNVLSPLIRVGYAFTDHLSLEVKGALDLYGGEIDKTGTEGSSTVKGYTLGIGPVWYLTERTSSLAGAWRPFVHGSVNYRDLRGNLRYAVSDFDPTVGVELGAGIQCNNFEVRLSYSHAVFDEDNRAADLSPSESSNDLDLSGVTMEVSWLIPMKK